MTKKGEKQSEEQISKRVASRKKSLEATGMDIKLRESIIERNKLRTGISHTEEHKAKISSSMKGKKNSLGTKRSKEFKEKLSIYWTNNPKHNFWKDGQAVLRRSERKIIMGRLEYRLWRTSVFERDNYTCQECGYRGPNLQADHIKPYSLFPELRFELDNGRTLCKKCHIRTPTYGIKAINY
jgi:hypothetical protein